MGKLGIAIGAHEFRAELAQNKVQGVKVDQSKFLDDPRRPRES